MRNDRVTLPELSRMECRKKYTDSDICVLMMQASISRSGIQEPLLIRAGGNAGRIIDGSLRFAALLRMRWEDLVPVCFLDAVEEVPLHITDVFGLLSSSSFSEVDIEKPECQERLACYIYGPEGADNFYKGNVKIPFGKRGKVKLVTYMLREKYPDFHIPESAVREELSFFDRAAPELAAARKIGAVSRKESFALSWLSPEEQKSSLLLENRDTFLQYVEEGMSNHFRPNHRREYVRMIQSLRMMERKLKSFEENESLENPEDIRKLQEEIAAFLRKTSI